MNQDDLSQMSENIIQSMTSGLMLIEGRDYTIVKFNKAMETIHGIPAEKAIGKRIEEVFSHIDGIPFDFFYMLMQNLGSLPRTKFRLVDRGEVIHRYIKGDTCFNLDGKPVGYMVIVDDITETEFVKESFGKYVARQVVEKILSGKGQIKLQGERQHVTVLFADVRGFTKLAENMEPENVVALLNKYFNMVVDIIFKYEGVLDKFIGDNVMAVFGAPIKSDNDEERAVSAAIEIQSGIEKFNIARKSDGEEPIFVGIGINTGEAVVGNIGSEKRMDYTVIGDTVNVADRIQSSALGGEILISSVTYEKVRDKFNCSELPAIKVKGRRNPVHIFKVVGVANS
ncbi:MAG: PAS domain S-box protein [Nitrospinae bacterium]|nr:PAS domain S-box protein [Nitrospinota bacterium]